MIMEALEKRKPVEFKEVDTLLFFGTNQVTDMEGVVSVISSLIRESRMLRRRIVSCEYSPDWNIMFRVRHPSVGDSPDSIGIDMYSERDRIFKNVKNILSSAFPDVNFPPFNWRGLHDNFDEVSVRVDTMFRDGTIQISFGDDHLGKMFPLFNFMKETEAENDHTINGMIIYASSLVDDVIIKDPKFNRLHDAVNGMDFYIEGLQRELGRLQAKIRKLKDQQIHFSRRLNNEKTRIQQEVLNESEREGLFNPIRDEADQRINTIEAQSLL